MCGYKKNFNYVQSVFPLDSTALEFCFCSKSLLLEAFSKRGNWALRHWERSEAVTEQESLGRNKGNWDNNIRDSESCSHREVGRWDVLWVRRSGAERRPCPQPVCWRGKCETQPRGRWTSVESSSKEDPWNVSRGQWTYQPWKAAQMKIPGISLMSKVLLTLGPSWWPCGWDSKLGVQVQSLVSELRSHKPHDKKKLL